MSDKDETNLEFSTNIHSMFGTDEHLEEDGAWVWVNEYMGIRIKIRRLRSDAVLKAFERIVRETYTDNAEELVRNPDKLESGQNQLIVERQLAEAVLIDWEGIRDRKTGKEIPYSPQAALQMMKIKDFREFVYEKAAARDTFREQADKDAEKNS